MIPSSPRWWYHIGCAYPGKPKVLKIMSFLFLCNILRKKWSKLIFCMQFPTNCYYDFRWGWSSIPKTSKRANSWCPWGSLPTRKSFPTYAILPKLCKAQGLPPSLSFHWSHKMVESGRNYTKIHWGRKTWMCIWFWILLGKNQNKIIERGILKSQFLIIFEKRKIN